MTVSSIGSGGGRDYSTIASWEAAAAATLTAPWEGECYNDSEFSVAGNIVTFAGITASATNFIELRPAAGEGFKDDAGATSNPVRYDQSQGVGLKCTASYVAAVLIQIDHVRLRGLQILHTGNGNDAACVSEDAGGTSSNLVRDCIMENTGNTSSYGGVLGVRGATVENVAAIHRGSGSQVVVIGNSGPTVMNCTAVRPDDLSNLSQVFAKYFSTACTITNTAGFGCTNFTGGGGSGFGGTNNATDLSSVGFGSSHQTSLTYSSQFENVNDTTRDFRLKSGSSLINNGTSTGAPTADIIGQTRSTTDIGAWEYVSAGITLNADQGTVTVTGYAATARFSVAAAQGTVAVSGQAATASFGMAAAQGSVTVSGQASTVGFLTAAAQGSLTVTGQDATVSWQMAGAQGAVAITGYDAEFTGLGALVMDADTGTLTVAGQDATVSWSVALDQGSISVSGEAAAVLWGLNADLGTLTLTGYAAEFDGAEEVEAPVEEPIVGGGRIVAGTFTRKKWRAIADAKRARQEAEDQARSLRAKRRKAIEEAAEKAGEAIAAAEQAGAEEETALRLEQMAEALDAARQATVLADAIREANEVVALANAVMRAIEDEREEEAVVSLLLL